MQHRLLFSFYVKYLVLSSLLLFVKHFKVENMTRVDVENLYLRKTLDLPGRKNIYNIQLNLQVEIKKTIE